MKIKVTTFSVIALEKSLSKNERRNINEKRSTFSFYRDADLLQENSPTKLNISVVNLEVLHIYNIVKR